MTIEYIRYRLPADKVNEFHAAYERAAESLRASPVCLGYELAACSEEQGVFILRIEWTSQDDHLNGFRKSAQFPPFLSHIRPYVPNIEEMRHYERTPVVWSRESA
jgi:quinol monooxygenase YgiN